MLYVKKHTDVDGIIHRIANTTEHEKVFKMT